MATFNLFRRLEPRQPDVNLDRGFRAETADAAYFIGKQWAMGEHVGEDASSPVQVQVRSQHVPIDPINDDPLLDPKVVPIEAIMEHEHNDWWTPGRRVHLGQAYAQSQSLGPPQPSDASRSFGTDETKLPPPYGQLNGRAWDGLEFYKADPAHAVFSEVPSQPVDNWDPSELMYSGSLTAGGVKLSVPRHDGGRLDWYSVDANSPFLPAPAQMREESLIVDRMTYPGAPHPRWWQIEDHTVDIGGFPPDRGHFATMLLVDVLVNHIDDLFSFPVSAVAGCAVRLDDVKLRDSFDDEWEILPPNDWQMFRVKGLDETSLIVWPSVTTPLRGPMIEEVLLGVDEDSNKLWAVELRAHGSDLPTEGVRKFVEDATNGSGGEQVEPADGSARIGYSYYPIQGAMEHWHPYQREQIDGRARFVQGRVDDPTEQPGGFMDEPVTELLYDRANYTEAAANQTEPVHQIEPATVPRFGLRLTRNRMLARDVNGDPVLWVQRHRSPLKEPPTPGLTHDALLPRRR